LVFSIQDFQLCVNVFFGVSSVCGCFGFIGFAFCCCENSGFTPSFFVFFRFAVVSVLSYLPFVAVEFLVLRQCCFGALAFDFIVVSVSKLLRGKVF